MKRVLTIFLVAAATTLMSVAALAQTAGPTGTQGTLQTGAAKKGHGAPNMKVMEAAQKEILPKLNLTSAQNDQITQLNSKTVGDLKDIRKQNKGDKPAITEKTKAALLDYHKQFLAILTPEQQEQWKTEMKAFEKKWRADHQKAKAGIGTTTTTTTTGTGTGTTTTGTGGTGH